MCGQACAWECALLPHRWASNFVKQPIRWRWGNASSSLATAWSPSRAITRDLLVVPQAKPQKRLWDGSFWLMSFRVKLLTLWKGLYSGNRTVSQDLVDIIIFDYLLSIFSLKWHWVQALLAKAPSLLLQALCHAAVCFGQLCFLLLKPETCRRT